MNGIYEKTYRGTPQGGNISIILSNIMLNELDKELERRGLQFVRYADDCIIFTKSRKAANRVMESITRFIECKLRLKVNKDKSKDKIKEITSRSNGMSMERRYEKLQQVIRGWVNHFKIAKMKKVVQELDQWIRHRLRMCHWKQWKKIGTRQNNLVKLGIENDKAWEFANTRKSYWRVSNSKY